MVWVVIVENNDTKTSAQFNWVLDHAIQRWPTSPSRKVVSSQCWQKTPQCGIFESVYRSWTTEDPNGGSTSKISLGRLNFNGLWCWVLCGTRLCWIERWELPSLMATDSLIRFWSYPHVGRLFFYQMSVRQKEDTASIVGKWHLDWIIHIDYSTTSRLQSLVLAPRTRRLPWRKGVRSDPIRLCYGESAARKAYDEHPWLRDGYLPPWLSSPSSWNGTSCWAFPRDLWQGQAYWSCKGFNRFGQGWIVVLGVDEQSLLLFRA